jgi:hypothetical protein
VQLKSTGAVPDKVARLVKDDVAERSAQQGDRYVGGGHGHAAICRQAVMGDAAVALAFVGFGDAQ